MNTNQINKLFKQYSCYVGTFACDQLPDKIEKRPFALIMNTDPITKPGQHWVALFVTKNNVAEYFDSYGFAPLNAELYIFLQSNEIQNLMFNTKQIQGITSTTCGAYCVTFLKLRCQNISFQEIIHLEFNDKNIQKFI
jgi:hypothetical protein